MSYEKGSLNYQVKVNSGWVEGHAKYADEEPHHGPGYSYVPMYSLARERLLSLIIEGKWKREKAKLPLVADILLCTEFPAISDDVNKDFEAAEKSGELRYSMIRDVNNCFERVALSEGCGYEIFGMGWDTIDQIDDMWVCYDYNGTIERT